jgi:hypothetical protein
VPSNASLFLGRIDLAIAFPLVSSESELVSPAGIVRGMSALHARPGPMPMLTLSVFISLAQADQMIKWFFDAFWSATQPRIRCQTKLTIFTARGSDISRLNKKCNKRRSPENRRPPQIIPTVEGKSYFSR